MTTLHHALARLERHVAERRAQRPDASRPPRRGTVPRPLPGEAPPRLFRREIVCHDRIFLESMPVSGLPQRVLYTGPQLAADDRRVWIGLLRWTARRKSVITIPEKSLLTKLGWGRGETDCIRLRRCLGRLRSGLLHIPAPQGKGLRHHPLLAETEWLPSPRQHSGRWRLAIDPAVRSLFQAALER